ncbi:MAG: hypothetical protein EVB03_01525 [SAR92 clade bacterium]|uniref:DUF4386 family protein n=1 Tax=SAR92 clade bacterium TaxID=2315479 RepID=A0A520MPD1_9GAMM|nr:MAG: hypothetical protein EVB03_01525 [SAR92 clade bacterium]
MQNKDYLLPGVAAIFVAVISPIYWLGMAASVGDSDVLWQDMMSLGFSDILFASILLLTIYIYLNLKNILNEQLNFNHIDLLVWIYAAINILWVSTLLLDVASAVLPENIVSQNEGTFLNIGLSIGVGAIVILGIIDLLIGILLLAKSTELPTLLKIFAIMSVIQGVLGITVVFAATLIFIFPITMIILAMFFLRKPESLELV